MTRIVADNPAHLASVAADHIVALLRDSPGDRVSLGLAGGSTPRATYELLRDANAPWEHVDAWLSDERWVPNDHEESNGRMARRALMDHVPATLLEIEYLERRLPQAGAQIYARNLEAIIGERPDVILLGMGDDGHTASLFPGTDALREEQADFVANFVPGRGWRLTATIPLLHRARHLVFLISGEGKAATIRQVMQGSDLPAARVSAGAEDVTWLLDEAAAAQLDTQ